MRGGDRNATDIAKIVEMIINRSSDSSIDILISDCVFSPGNKYPQQKDANNYLIGQQIGIKRIIAEKLKSNPEFSVIVYQLTSDFRGKYYNRIDIPTIINDVRPFYIWIMGPKQQLKRLTETVRIEKMKGSGVVNSFYISNETLPINYGISMIGKIGKWNPDPNDPKTSIIKAKVDKKSGFVLPISVDFSAFLIDDNLLMDPDNYYISNKAYRIKISKLDKGGYTHLLKLILNTKSISKGPVTLYLKSNYPQWVDVNTDTDGADINASGAMSKTYGLKFLVGGICDAYDVRDNLNKTGQNPNYSCITINIK